MTNLQKIQQETEEIFFNKYPVGMETIDFLHSRESIAYKAGLEGVREKVKENPIDKAHTYGSENADVYRAYDAGQEQMKQKVLTLIDEEINKAA